MKFKKIPVEIEATQWFENGDHPEDEVGKSTSPGNREGKVVRYFRRPDTEDSTVCSKCEKIMRVHGWIDTLEGGHIVCPGDWIITGIEGEKYPCKPGIFEKTYNKSIQSKPSVYEVTFYNFTGARYVVATSWDDLGLQIKEITSQQFVAIKRLGPIQGSQ